MGLFWFRGDNKFAIIALLDKASLLLYFTIYRDFFQEHEIHQKMSEML